MAKMSQRDGLKSKVTCTTYRPMIFFLFRDHIRDITSAILSSEGFTTRISFLIMANL
jgi:hypothetical protein